MLRSSRHEARHLIIPSREPLRLRSYGDAMVAVGDKVSWNTSQGKTHGKVVERKTADFEFDGQKFTASKDEPAFIVESDKTGAQAAHKGSALTQLK